MSSNKYHLYLLLLLGGIAETGRYYVAYVYAVEIFPKTNQEHAGLVIFTGCAFMKMIVCCYFWLSVQKDWKFSAIVSLVLSIISLLLTLHYLPESPRFLFAKKEYDLFE